MLVFIARSLSLNTDSFYTYVSQTSPRTRFSTHCACLISISEAIIPKTKSMITCSSVLQSCSCYNPQQGRHSRGTLQQLPYLSCLLGQALILMSTKEQSRWGSPYNTIQPHQPTTGPSPHASGAERRKGMQRTQIKGSKERIPCPGPSQGCHRKASAPVSSHKTYEDKSTLQHLLDWGGLLPNTTGHVMRHQRIRIVQDLWDVYGKNQRQEKRWYRDEQTWGKKKQHRDKKIKKAGHL